MKTIVLETEIGTGAETRYIPVPCRGNVGNILTGVPDTTNKGLIFDPDSATAANKVLKIVFLADLYGADGSVTVSIEFDDAAYVEQAASEA
jgi:hypothetical protein